MHDVGDSSSFRILETDEFRKSLKKLPPLEAGFVRKKLTASQILESGLIWRGKGGIPPGLRW